MGTDNGLPSYFNNRPKNKRKPICPICPIFPFSCLSSPLFLGVVVFLSLVANFLVLVSVWKASDLKDGALCPPCSTNLIDGKADPALNQQMLDEGDELSRKANVQRILVSIMTIPRPNDERYLLQTLGSLRREIASSNGAIVGVLVSNLRPGTHKIFDEAKALLQEIFAFREITPRRGIDQEWQGKWGKVLPSMYQLNLDFLESMIQTQKYCQRDNFETVLLLEDDFDWCPFGFSHIVQAIGRAKERSPDWITIRFSYGNNGLLFRCDDLPQIIKFAELNKKLGPLDSLIGDGLTQPRESSSEFHNRTYLTYRHNLLEHIGESSARKKENYAQLAKSEGRLCYPRCYDLVQYIGLMPKENFVFECLGSDFSPCEKCGGRDCHGISHPTLMSIISKRIEIGEC